MKTQLQLIATLLFIGATLTTKAQSTLTLKNINIKNGAKNNTLSASEKEKWSNKIKPFYTKISSQLKSQPIKIDKVDPVSDYNYGNIDEKMCMLIKTDTFVDTDFRMPISSENIDLKMVYPKRNFVK